jgi:hypothetical protein
VSIVRTPNRPRVRDCLTCWPLSLFRISADQGIWAAQNGLASLQFYGHVAFLDFCGRGVLKDALAASFCRGKFASRGDENAFQFLLNGGDSEEDDFLRLQQCFHEY